MLKAFPAFLHLFFWQYVTKITRIFLFANLECWRYNAFTGKHKQKWKKQTENGLKR